MSPSVMLMKNLKTLSDTCNTRRSNFSLSNRIETVYLQNFKHFQNKLQFEKYPILDKIYLF